MTRANRYNLFASSGIRATWRIGEVHGCYTVTGHVGGREDALYVEATCKCGNIRQVARGQLAQMNKHARCSQCRKHGREMTV